MGSENGKFLTPKVLAARPNLREWWVGEKIAATNDVGDDGIVDGSSAITKTMRIRLASYHREIGFPPYKRILWIQKILRLWLIRISQKILAAGQTCGAYKIW